MPTPTATSTSRITCKFYKQGATAHPGILSHKATPNLTCCPPTAIPVCDKIIPFWQVDRVDSLNWLFPFHHLHCSFLLTWKTWKLKQYQKNEIFAHPIPSLPPYFGFLASGRARANIQFAPLLFQKCSIKHGFASRSESSFPVIIEFFPVLCKSFCSMQGDRCDSFPPRGFTSSTQTLHGEWKLRLKKQVGNKRQVTTTPSHSYSTPGKYFLDCWMCVFFQNLGVDL